MDLVILSRSPALYSTRRLGLAAMGRGHNVRVFDPLRCSLVFGCGAATIFVRGEAIASVDAVISRTTPASTWHAIAVLRQFELAGAYCLNRSEPVARARDKLQTLQLLASQGVRIAPTALASHPDDVRHVIEQLGGPPTVVKFSQGSQGAGVMLAESAASAASVIDALVVARRNLLVQQFIPHEGDARLFVVGSKVVAAIRRRARDGDFRANLHQGGAAEALDPTQEQSDAALVAARALGLELAGVDMLDGPAGPLVVEVNASPGLEGIEAASGRNIASTIIRFLETRVRRPVPTS